MKKPKYTAAIFVALASAFIFCAILPVEQVIAAQIKSAFVLSGSNPEFKNTSELQQFRYPQFGSRYGTITCKACNLEAPLYYGDDDEILEKGAGQYSLSGMPGQGKTILVAGHDMTFFKQLQDIEKNHIIEVKTFYGMYKYKVTDTKILKADDPTIYQPAEEEELILYTCYPFGLLLGDRDQRYLVYCQKIWGPSVEEASND